MTNPILLTGMLFPLLFLPLRAAEPDPAQNAALQYWRAFQFEAAVASEDGALTNAHQLIQNATMGKFTPRTDDYFQRVQSYLDLMRLGASQPYCEWGPHSNPLEIPHLLKGRSLARLSSARLRHLISSGQTEEAIDLFKSALQMTEHLDDGSLLIGALLKNSSQALLINAAAAELPNLNRDNLARFARVIDDHLPQAQHRLGRTFLNDYKFGLDRVRTAAEQLKGGDPAPLKKQLQELGILAEISTAADASSWIKQSEARVQRIAEILRQPDLSAIQDQLEKLGSEPVDLEFEKAVLDSAVGSVHRARDAEVRLRMFQAAIATLLDGKDGLNRYPEPYVGRSFHYEAQFRNRFLLRSNQDPGSSRPQELQVGQLDSIHDAAAAGDLEQVEYHLRKRAVLDRPDTTGWAPLHYAAHHGHLEMVELLVKEGATINFGTFDPSAYQMDPVLAQRYGLALPQNRGKTALDLAVESGRHKVAAFLKENGGKSGDELWPRQQDADADPGIFEMRLASDTPGDNTRQASLITRAADKQRQSRQVLHLQNRRLLDQSDVRQAAVRKNQVTGHTEIQIIFTDKGRTKFAQVTRENVGSKLAILIEGELLSAPVIRTEISGGTAVISGDFTAAEAEQVARKINESIQRR
jgi:hypothetical protein